MLAALLRLSVRRAAARRPDRIREMSTKASATVLNADKLNYDKTLSFASLEKVVGVLSLHENTTPENAISKVPDGCAVVVTKEMELGESIIRGLPESCKLICEAGEFERQFSRFWRGIEN